MLVLSIIIEIWILGGVTALFLCIRDYLIHEKTDEITYLDLFMTWNIYDYLWLCLIFIMSWIIVYNYFIKDRSL